ncbi:hypothetical protein NPIL_476221 [Nephila pilipes]|uniref:Uncharacterized protein n=1 Tax=Nephila pilipes TaxID=299642 RepID=A0A8X6UFI2_NEPPI|nr:hypothetical protein NPIL_476221 [Nephila pilipes]
MHHSQSNLFLNQTKPLKEHTLYSSGGFVEQTHAPLNCPVHQNRKQVPGKRHGYPGCPREISISNVSLTSSISIEMKLGVDLVTIATGARLPLRVCRCKGVFV